MKKQFATFFQLQTLAEHSHSPYSGIKVACIIETKAGQLIKGVNLESLAYPCGLCAEQSAIAQLITLGIEKKTIIRAYIYCSVDGRPSPCGKCRQLLFEFLPIDTEIELYNNHGAYGKRQVRFFLPDAPFD